MSTVRVGTGFRKKNLVEALTSAAPGTTLLLDPGVYPVPEGISLYSAILRGEGEPGSVILDATVDVNGEAHLSNLTVRAPAFKNGIIVRQGARATLEGVTVIAEPASDKVGIWVPGGNLQATSCRVYRAPANRADDTIPCAIKAEASAHLQLARTVCQESQLWVLGQSSAQLSNVTAGQLWAQDGSRVSSPDILRLSNSFRQRGIVVKGEATCDLAYVHSSEENPQAYCENGFLRLGKHTVGVPAKAESLPVYVEGRSAVDAPAEAAHVVDTTQNTPEPSKPKTVSWAAGAQWEDVAQDLKVGDTLLLEEGEHVIPQAIPLQFDILGKGRSEKVLLSVPTLTVEDGSVRHLSNLTLNGVPEHNVLIVRAENQAQLSSVHVSNDCNRSVFTIWVEGGRLDADNCTSEFVGVTSEGVAELTGCSLDSIEVASGRVNLERCQLPLDTEAGSTRVTSGQLTASHSDVGVLIANGGRAELSFCTAGLLQATQGGSITSNDQVEQTPVPGYYACFVEENSTMSLNRLLFPEPNISLKIRGTLSITELVAPEPGTVDLGEDAEAQLPEWLMRHDLDGNPLATTQADSGHEERPLTDDASGGDKPNDAVTTDNEATDSAKDAADQPSEASPQQATEDPMADIDALIGLEKVKKQIRRFLRTVEFNQQREAQGHRGVEMSLHSLFLGSPGTGKTTVARLLGEALAQAGVIRSDVFVEVGQEDLVSPNIGETPQKTRAVLERALGGILFVDEAYSLYQEAGGGGYGPQAVDTILKFMEDHRRDIMVIFAGYTDKMQDFLNMNPGLRSRVGNTFEFEDYTPDEIASIGLSMLHSAGWSVNAELYTSIVKRKYARSSDHSNGRWIRNQNDDLIGVVVDRYAESGGDVSTILDEDLYAYSGGDATSRKDSVDELLGQLDAMVGLAPVKEFVRDLVIQVQAGQMLARAGRPASQPTYHMVFEGNPGTGKTTVAEIVAKLFHALGILENSSVKTVERRDLVGSYVGHTEQQTGRAIDQAMGGVLFVDEAYQLSVEGFERDFGRQAIETLLTALENQRSSFVAIFAGYTDQMERFLDQNPGLRSRIPHTIVFPDYSPVEVGQIVVNRISRDWDVNEDLLRRVAAEAYAKLEEKERSNGRWARIFAERLELAHKRGLVQREDAAEDLTRIPDDVVESLA